MMVVYMDPPGCLFCRGVGGRLLEGAGDLVSWL